MPRVIKTARQRPRHVLPPVAATPDAMKLFTQISNETAEDDSFAGVHFGER